LDGDGKEKGTLRNPTFERDIAQLGPRKREGFSLRGYSVKEETAEEAVMRRGVKLAVLLLGHSCSKGDCPKQGPRPSKKLIMSFRA